MYIKTFCNMAHSERAYGAISCEITEDINKLSTNGRIVIPRYNPIKETDFFRRGDVIEITMGYLGDTDDGLLNINDFKVNDVNLKKSSYVSKNIPIDGTYDPPDLLVSKNGLDRKFYISRVDGDSRTTTIEFEDFMFNLKNPKIANDNGFAKTGELVYMSYNSGKKSGSAQYQDKIQENFMKTVIESLHIEYHLAIKTYPQDLLIPLEKYKIEGLTWAQILDKMRKDYLISIHFYGDELWFFMPYQKMANEKLDPDYGQSYFSYVDKLNQWTRHSLTFSWDYTDEISEYLQPIIEYDLEYTKPGDLEVQMKGKNFKKDATLDEYKYPEDNRSYDRTIDLVYFNLSSKEFKASVKEQQKNYDISGFSGDFKTFGALPNNQDITLSQNNVSDHIRTTNREYVIGDRVSFSNLNSFTFDTTNNIIPQIENKSIENDEYLVEIVEYTYSSEGIRQNVTIGRKIGKDNEKS